MGSAAAALFLCLITIIFVRRSQIKASVINEAEIDAQEMEEEDFLKTLPGLPPRFTYDELKEATDNFSRKLGAGGFGSVYEGILNDKTGVAVKKLSDFGISKLIAPDFSHASTEIKGTTGYLDPEYFTRGKLTEASDVYSFGIVLLHLISRYHVALPYPDVVPWANISLSVPERDVAKLGKVLERVTATNLTAIQNNLWNDTIRRALLFNEPF